jgi:P-type Cu+ transporter
MAKTKKVFKLKGLHCSSCALMIEGNLEDVGANATCDFASEKVEVEWDGDKVDEQSLVEAIEKDGYKVVGRG